MTDTCFDALTLRFESAFKDLVTHLAIIRYNENFVLKRSV